jgi:hypothetical protein
VLVGLDVGLDVLRRHQARVVAELDQLARPVVRAAAGLETDHAARQIGEDFQHLAACQTLLQHPLAPRIDAVNLEQGLGDVQPDRGSLHVGRLPHSWLFCDFHLGTSMPSAGGVHLIMRPWESVARRVEERTDSQDRMDPGAG